MADATHQSLRERVDQTIDTSSAIVTERVVGHFVETEIKRRADLIVTGINLLRQAEQDHRKIKPDSITYSEHGIALHEGYSKGKLDEKKKSSDRIEKIRRAIDAALLEKPDFSKLDEIVKKGGKSDDKAESE